jgi:autotransporter-associated beta strand protein/YVTN family beta-propeller protein
MIWACLSVPRNGEGQVEVDAYITNFGASDVSVINTATNTVIASPIPVQNFPAGVAITPDGRFALITNENATGTVSIIDAAARTALPGSIPVGTFPIGIAVTPNARFAYVANGNDTVSVFEVSTNSAPIATVPLGTGTQPFGVAVTPDGRFAYISNFGTDTVSVIATATNTVVGSPIPVGVSPEGVAVTPDGRFVYVTNFGDGTVSVINRVTNVVTAISVGGSPAGIAITPNGNLVFIATQSTNSVSVINTTTNQVVSIPAGNTPEGVAITPDGSFAYVTNFGDNTVSVIKVGSNTVLQTIGVGNQPASFGAFIGPNLIVAQGGPLSIAGDSALTPLGFGKFVDFAGGTLRTTGNLITSRTISLLAPGGTIDTNGFDSVMSGDIINSGSLTKIGAGTLTLLSNNSYSGGTNILGGVLSVSSDTNLGTGAVKFGSNAELLTTGTSFSSGKTIILGNGGGTLASSSGTTAIYGGVIGGTGPLSIGDGINQGTIVLHGINTYSGGTTINRAVLQISADANLGFAAGGLTFNGGTLQTMAGFGTARSITLGGAGAIFAPAAATTFTVDGAITGVGGLTKTEAGTLIIGGINGYTGGTTVIAGTLQAGTAGGFVGGTTYTVNGGTLDLNSFDLTLSSLNGAGGIVNLGSAALTINNTGTDVYTGVIQGAGSLTKTGAGTQTLSGNNIYTGGTLLNAGTLVANGAQALGLGDVVVHGGVLRTDLQSINVKGNFAQNAGGTLQLGLGGNVPGQSDLLNVGDHAALDGTLQLLSLNGFQPKIGDKLNLVLAAGGVSGQFAHVLDPFSPLIALDLVYGPNSVVLEFASNFAQFALTPNQLAVASQLDRVAFDPREALLIAFLQNQPVANLGADFAKISPDSLSAMYEVSFSAVNVQAANLENRFSEIRNGSTGFTSTLNLSNSPGTMVESKDGKTVIAPGKNVWTPSPENKWGIWVSGNGDFVNVDGDGNAEGYDFTTAGVTLGLDYRLTNNFAIGISASYAHTDTNLVGDGSIDINSGGGGIYATFFTGGLAEGREDIGTFYLNGYVGGGYNSYGTRRDALAGNATGSTEGGQFNALAGGGYDFRFGSLTFGPIASFQYTDVDFSSFSENGSLAPLTIESKSEDSLRTNLGVSASYIWRFGNTQITPKVRVSWQHEFSYRALPIDAQFASGAGSTLTVRGPELGVDSALIDAGLNVQWTSVIGTYFGYEGQVGRTNYDSHGVICSAHFDF